MKKRSSSANNLSRREFIKNTGLLLGGLTAGIGGASYISGCNQKTLSLRIFASKGRIVQSPRSVSACIGCGTCELVCATFHSGATGPDLRRIWLERDEINLSHHAFTCLQCDYPSCYFACPDRDNALCIDRETGTRYIASEKCRISCDACIKACPLDPPRISYDPRTQTALMCDLCKNRPEGPVCVEFCPVSCLELMV